MDAQKKTCFVISPIGERGSQIRQAADDFLEFIVRQCAAISDGYKVTRADEINEPGRITSQVVRRLHDADLVIADVSGDNVNVYYELALRHAIGKPLITCVEDGTLLPFDTRDNRTIFYSLHSRRAAEARRELAEQVRAINSGDFHADNPITEALRVVELAKSDNSGERSLAAILEKLDGLGSRMNALEQVAEQRARTLKRLRELNAQTRGKYRAQYAPRPSWLEPTNEAKSYALPAALDEMNEKAKNSEVRASREEEPE